MSYKVAVVGATGNVGKQILKILDERDFPVSDVVALSSKRTEGKELSFGDTKILKAQPLEKYDFEGTDIALFSPGSEVSKKYAPIAGDAGCVVIDNTSYFRMFDDVPLVIPEVNPQDIAKYGDYPFENALFVLVTKKHIKCISYKELSEGKEITTTSHNYLGKRKEFDTDKELIIEYCKYAVKFFENV